MFASSDQDIDNAFTRFGLNKKTATFEDVRKNYKALMLKYHPDRNLENPEASEIAKQITEDYNLLARHFEQNEHTIPLENLYKKEFWDNFYDMDEAGFYGSPFQIIPVNPHSLVSTEDQITKVYSYLKFTIDGSVMLGDRRANDTINVMDENLRGFKLTSEEMNKVLSFQDPETGCTILHYGAQCAGSIPRKITIYLIKHYAKNGGFDFALRNNDIRFKADKKTVYDFLYPGEKKELDSFGNDLRGYTEESFCSNIITILEPLLKSRGVSTGFDEIVDLYNMLLNNGLDKKDFVRICKQKIQGRLDAFSPWRKPEITNIYNAIIQLSLENISSLDNLRNVVNAYLGSAESKQTLSIKGAEDNLIQSTIEQDRPTSLITAKPAQAEYSGDKKEDIPSITFKPKAFVNKKTNVDSSPAVKENYGKNAHIIDETGKESEAPDLAPGDEIYEKMFGSQQDHMWCQVYQDFGKAKKDLDSGEEKYKIHLAIPMKLYESRIGKIEEILKNAINQGVILTYKKIGGDPNYGERAIYNTKTMEKSIQRSKDRNDPKSAIQAKKRLYNNPVTIYIPDNVDVKKLADLCIALEKNLSDIPLKHKYLSTADLPLSNHVSFRRETIDREQVSVAEAPEDVLLKLKEAGSSSKLFQELQNQIKGSFDAPLKSTKLGRSTKKMDVSTEVESNAEMLSDIDDTLVIRINTPHGTRYKLNDSLIAAMKQKKLPLTLITNTGVSDITKIYDVASNQKDYGSVCTTYDPKKKDGYGCIPRPVIIEYLKKELGLKDIPVLTLVDAVPKDKYDVPDNIPEKANATGRAYDSLRDAYKNAMNFAKNPKPTEKKFNKNEHPFDIRANAIKQQTSINTEHQAKAVIYKYFLDSKPSNQKIYYFENEQESIEEVKEVARINSALKQTELVPCPVNSQKNMPKGYYLDVMAEKSIEVEFEENDKGKEREEIIVVGTEKEGDVRIRNIELLYTPLIPVVCKESKTKGFINHISISRLENILRNVTKDEGLALELKSFVNNEVTLRLYFSNSETFFTNEAQLHEDEKTHKRFYLLKFNIDENARFYEPRPRSSLFTIPFTLETQIGANQNFNLNHFDQYFESDEIKNEGTKIKFAVRSSKKQNFDDIYAEDLIDRDILPKSIPVELLERIRKVNGYLGERAKESGAIDYYNKRQSWQKILEGMDDYLKNNQRRSRRLNKKPVNKLDDLITLIEHEADKYRGLANRLGCEDKSKSRFYNVLSELANSLKDYNEDEISLKSDLKLIETNIVTYLQLYDKMDECKYATARREFDYISFPVFFQSTKDNNEKIEDQLYRARRFYELKYNTLDDVDKNDFPSPDNEIKEETKNIKRWF